MKLASKIVTGLAILGLAAPVLAAESAPAGQAAPATAQTKTHRHARKVAQHTEKKGEAKKVEKKEKAPAKGEKAAEKAPAKAEPAAPAAK